MSANDEIQRLKSAISLSTIISATLPLTKEGHEYVACCPFHQERTASFKVNDEKHFFHCFGCGAHGDVFDWLTRQRGMSLPQAIEHLGGTNGANGAAAGTNGAAHDEWTPLIPPPEDAHRPDLSGYDAIYTYAAADGSPLFYVRRRNAVPPARKAFHPLTYGVLKGRKGWHARHPNAPRPLYGLDRLHAKPTANVIVCEGEKAANAAQIMFPDLVCVTWSAGSKAMQYTDWAPLEGRKIAIWPDNDKPGIEAAQWLASRFPDAKLVQVSDLPEHADAADIQPPPNPIAWLKERITSPSSKSNGDARHDDARQDAKHDDANRPGHVIQCVAGELPRMVQEAETALLDSGAPIYQRSVLVRPAEQQYPAADGSTTHSVALVPITGPTMMAMLAAAATWRKWDGRAKCFVNCDPPTKVVDILLANRGQWRFPVVRGVLTSPTIRPDGTLLKDPGYDFASRYYLMFPTGLKLPDIPDRPTLEDALDALTRLDRLLDGYDFVADGGISRSVALCILMTQVLRCGMAVSPLLAVSATAPGSGKSHLIDLASTIAIGRPCPIMGAGKSDEETEKGINTNLLSGVAGFSIDNVHRMVDLAVLNIATERPMVGIRLFGVLDKVEVENSVTIYMTGNNLPVVDEQVRRTLLCSMDVGVERPEQREFGDNDPIKAVLADRGRYIADILIIALAYLAHGTKTADIRPFGSYPGWSKLVREPLIWLGRPDPVASQNASRASDPETGRLRAVVGAWDDAFGSMPTTLAEATRTATTVPFLQHREHGESESDYQFRVDAHAAQVLLQEELLTVLQEAFPGRGGKGSEIDTGKWGYWMRKYAGRVTDNKKFIDAGKHKNVTMWQLVSTQSNAKVGLGG